MPKCEDQNFPCQSLDYSPFDQVAESELRSPIFADEIVNSSGFCTFVPTDTDLMIGDLTHKSFLKGLRGKSGLYHLWIDYDDCDDHGTKTMLCVYVGKGFAEVRITDHIKTKWQAGAQLYVTFFEFTNRLSKYYEQLFLDTYKFELNTNENTGTRQLFAVWDEERHFLGTELNAVSNLSKIRSFEDI